MRERNIKELAGVLSRIEDKEFMALFLKEILTPSEIDHLVLRWELLKLLNRRMPQRKISKMLGISLCKITRGSRELKKKNSAIKTVLKKYTTQNVEKTKEV